MEHYCGEHSMDLDLDGPHRVGGKLQEPVLAIVVTGLGCLHLYCCIYIQNLIVLFKISLCGKKKFGRFALPSRIIFFF